MQIFSRISILFTVFNQIRLKNYQIKTNKIFNFSHKISKNDISWPRNGNFYVKSMIFSYTLLANCLLPT